MSVIVLQLMLTLKSHVHVLIVEKSISLNEKNPFQRYSNQSTPHERHSHTNSFGNSPAFIRMSTANNPTSTKNQPLISLFTAENNRMDTVYSLEGMHIQL